MQYGKGVGGVVANPELGYIVSEEWKNPVTNIGWEALVSDDLSQPLWVEVIVEAQDVEEQQGSGMVCGLGGLYSMDKDGDCVDSSMVWVGSKLCYG